MKTDKINFTGFKNVGGLKLNIVDSNMKTFRRMMIELTDDGIADLADFRKYLDKLRFQREDNFLQLDIYEFKTLNPTTRSPMHFFANGNPIDIKPKNIPFLTKLSDLTSDISTTEDRDFIASGKYINSEQCVKNFTDNAAIEFDIKNSIKYDTVHSPNTVRASAEAFCVAFNDFTKSILSTCN